MAGEAKEGMDVEKEAGYEGKNAGKGGAREGMTTNDSKLDKAADVAKKDKAQYSDVE